MRIGPYNAKIIPLLHRSATCPEPGTDSPMGK